jgi:hypothetical protein
MFVYQTSKGDISTLRYLKKKHKSFSRRMV